MSRGREACFLCTYCGKFVSYDRRKTGIEYRESHIFDVRDETYDLDYEPLMYHRKCDTIERNKKKHLDITNK